MALASIDGITPQLANEMCADLRHVEGTVERFSRCGDPLWGSVDTLAGLQLVNGERVHPKDHPAEVEQGPLLKSVLDLQAELAVVVPAFADGNNLVSTLGEYARYVAIRENRSTHRVRRYQPEPR
jgi:hypothetical protein